MASSTKIINVLKDDSFEEILGIFKITPAEEVIFVLPKSARAFKKEEHFASLQDESKSLNKAVSFLCSDAELNDLAKKYKFDVLLAHSPAPRKSKKQPSDLGSINVVNQIEDFYSEPIHEEDSILTTPAMNILEDSSGEDNFTPALAAISQNGRRLDDVFVPEDEHRHSVKVSGKTEKAVPVDVYKEGFGEYNLDNELSRDMKSVWGSSSVPLVAKVRSSKNLLSKILSPIGKLFSSQGSNLSKESRASLRPAHRTGLIVLSLVAVIILGAVIFISTGKAQVTIKPVSQPLDFRLAIFSSDSISSTSLERLSIPGQLFNIKKTVSQDFPATGHVDVAQKARGTITVYNELPVDQPLVTTTRFESSDKHIFRTLTSIVVPAAKTVGGKIVPSSRDVLLIADKAGKDYNIPAGKFTIPAFKEQGSTEKYEKVYGQSSSPMNGGTSGQSTVATEDDLNKAKEILAIQLASNIKDDLESQMDRLNILNANQVMIESPVSKGLKDSSAVTFTVSLSGSLKTIGFKDSDLITLVAQYVDSQKGMKTIPEKITINYDNPHWDEAKNGLSFNIHVTGPGYAKIDRQKISSDLLGKNDTEMRAYLGQISGVSSAQVSLSPFWVRSIPKDGNKVEIIIDY